MQSLTFFRSIGVTKQPNEGITIMRIKRMNMMGFFAAAAFGVVAVTGCNDKSQPGEAMEKTGAALDTAAKKTGAAVNTAAEKTATATRDAAGAVVDKTGELLEKAGAAVEGAGADMQQ